MLSKIELCGWNDHVFPAFHRRIFLPLLHWIKVLRRLDLSLILNVLNRDKITAFFHFWRDLVLQIRRHWVIPALNLGLTIRAQRIQPLLWRVMYVFTLARSGSVSLVNALILEFAGGLLVWLFLLLKFVPDIVLAARIPLWLHVVKDSLSMFNSFFSQGFLALMLLENVRIACVWVMGTVRLARPAPFRLLRAWLFLWWRLIMFWMNWLFLGCGWFLLLWFLLFLLKF